MECNIPFHYDKDNYRILLIAAIISVLISMFRFNQSNYTMNTTMTAEKYHCIFWKDSRTMKYINNYQYSFPPMNYDYKNQYLSEKCGERPLYNIFFSQEKEYLFIYETFFYGTNLTGYNGTYVELGAFDGLKGSNTLFFDMCLGWKGLLIESDPQVYPKLINNRPLAHKMNFSPNCSQEYHVVNTSTNFSPYLRLNLGLGGNEQIHILKQPIHIPCGPLGPILEHVFEGEYIQFFSLDFKGVELFILNTIDFSRVQINIFLIKIHNVYCGEDCEIRDKIFQKMRNVGYLKYEGLAPFSDIYVHSLSPYKFHMSSTKFRGNDDR